MLIPIVSFGNRSDIHETVVTFIKPKPNKPKYHCFYDLFSGSGILSLSAIEHDIAEKYVINDVNPAIRLFWLQVKNNPELLIKTYHHLLKQYQDPDFDKDDFYVELQKKFNEFKMDDIEYAATFAFLINHAESALPTFSEKNKLACKHATKKTTELIDKNFEPAVKAIHQKFVALGDRITFSAKCFHELTSEFSSNDLILCDPPYPDMPDAEENPSNHIYYRSEPKSQLQQQLNQFILQCQQKNIPFLLFYGVVGLKHEYPLNKTTEHFLVISDDPNNPFGSFVNHLFTSNHFADNALDNVICFDDNIANQLENVDYAKAVGLVKDMMHNPESSDKIPLTFKK